MNFIQYCDMWICALYTSNVKNNYTKWMTNSKFNFIFLIGIPALPPLWDILIINITICYLFLVTMEMLIIIINYLPTQVKLILYFIIILPTYIILMIYMLHNYVTSYRCTWLPVYENRTSQILKPTNNIVNNKIYYILVPMF